MRAGDWSALSSMKDKLAATGLYRLDEATLADAELKAYAAGLEPVYTLLDELERECFLPTATGWGLDLRERLFGLKRSALPAADRRRMLAYRGAVTANDFNSESIARAVTAAGMETTITEDIPGKRIYLNCRKILDETKPKAQLIAEATQFLPAHLEAQFDFGYVTWDYIDGQDRTFDQMDGKNFTWDTIDQIGI